MVVVAENYKNRQVCDTCNQLIPDGDVSIVHKRKWYHASCWIKNKSIKTKKRDINFEELEVF